MTPAQLEHILIKNDLKQFKLNKSSWSRVPAHQKIEIFKRVTKSSNTHMDLVEQLYNISPVTETILQDILKELLYTQTLTEYDKIDWLKKMTATDINYNHEWKTIVKKQNLPTIIHVLDIFYPDGLNTSIESSKELYKKILYQIADASLESEKMDIFKYITHKQKTLDIWGELLMAYIKQTQYRPHYSELKRDLMIEVITHHTPLFYQLLKKPSLDIYHIKIPMNQMNKEFYEKLYTTTFSEKLDRELSTPVVTKKISKI